jgi:hypothetical protein
MKTLVFKNSSAWHLRSSAATCTSGRGMWPTAMQNHCHEAEDILTSAFAAVQAKVDL